jgi:HemY protein
VFAVWVADRPGDVTIRWLGSEVQIQIIAIVVPLALVGLAIIWSLVRNIIRMPGLFLRRRRAAHGYSAITRGLIAVGAGDPYAARRFAREANRIAADEPLALLLCAQSAQMAGNRAAAEQMFRLMAEREDTKLIGLHGLFVEAQRRDDANAARLFAEEAAKSAPSLAWAGQAVLDFRCAGADWVGAIEALDRNMKNDLVSKPAYKRQRAVLLTARALTLVETERDAAKAMILEAVKLAPDFVPAVAFAGRLLAEAGEPRKAARLLEKAWHANPHPDLAEVYAHLRPGDSARDRLARVQALAQKPEGHLEGGLAVARTAVDAREFAVARQSLAPFVSTATQRVAMLMAEIEDLEHGDVGRAREWMRRALHAARDPAWTADGVVSDKWLPISTVTGRLDAFQWRVPLAHLAAPGPVIEDRALFAAASAEVESVDPPLHREDPKDEDLDNEDLETMPVPSPVPTPATVTRGPVPPIRPRPEAVIPLLHVPDDPGPDAALEHDAMSEPQGEGWRRLRGLFW